MGEAYGKLISNTVNHDGGVTAAWRSAYPASKGQLQKTAIGDGSSYIRAVEHSHQGCRLDFTVYISVIVLFNPGLGRLIDEGKF